MKRVEERSVQQVRESWHGVGVEGFANLTLCPARNTAPTYTLKPT